MWWTSVLLILAATLHQGDSDCYGQSPRFSNNRLDGDKRERQTNNRICDTQNNNRAGYNVGGPANRRTLLNNIYQKSKNIREKGIRAKMEEEEGPAGKMKYYENSKLFVTWTNQHECGGTNTKCEVVFQYMCDDKLRDGFEVQRIPESMRSCDTGEDGKTKNCDDDRRFGMHENNAYYTLCKNTQRNTMLYQADRNLNGDTAKYTRQNNNGNRNGYECPEERDYYPYWRPSPWVDIAVMTDDTERCEWYKKESENVKPRYFCKIPDKMMEELQKENKQGLQIPITEEGCKKFTYKEYKGEWVQDQRPLHPAPLCFSNPVSRDNHHGNKADGFMGGFNWTIPNKPHSHCALRLRYNITTMETPWEMDQSPIHTEPYQNMNEVNFRCGGKKFCCTAQEPCYLGDGNCASNAECRPGLVCGSANSPIDRTTNLCIPDKYQIRRPAEGLTLVSASSSSYYREKHEPEFAFTGRSHDNDGGFFHSSHENNPWVRLEIKPFQITTLTIINRWDCCGDRLRNLEIRAGQSEILFSNPVVATYEGPGQSRAEYVIPFNKPTQTKYITMQIKQRDRAYLQINGIKVNEPTGANCPDKDLDYRLHDLRREDRVGTWQECGKKCSARSDCKAWSWQRSRQSCYLKRSSYMRGRTRDLSMISGVRGCVGNDGNSRKRRDIEMPELDEKLESLVELMGQLKGEFEHEKDVLEEKENTKLLQLDEELNDVPDDEAPEDDEERFNSLEQDDPDTDDEYQRRANDIDSDAMLRDAYQDKEKKEIRSDPLGKTESWDAVNLVNEDGGVTLKLVDQDDVEKLKKCPPTERTTDTDLSFTIQRERSSSRSSITYMRSETVFPVFTAPMKLEKSKLLATLPKWGKTYSVSFEVNPTEFQWRWQNVIHLTTGGDNNGRGSRIPNVNFRGTRPSSSGARMQICSAINWSGNSCRYARSLVPKGQWTKVEISQQPEGQYHRYKVVVGGQQVYSIVNTKAQEYENVKVYAADPFHTTAKASIRNLELKSPVLDMETFSLSKGASEFTQLSYDGKSLTCTGGGDPKEPIKFLEQRPIIQGSVLYTIPKFGKEYSVKLDVNPTSFPRGWSNALQLAESKNTRNCCNNGGRVPTILFYSRSSSSTSATMYVCSSVNNNGNKCFTKSNVRRGQWTNVEVTQSPAEGGYQYEVKVNGEKIGSELNLAAREFEAVQIMASNRKGWNYPTPGFIKNLVILGRTSLAECQGLEENKKVPAVVVSLNFSPQNGEAPNNEWWRNKYSLSGSHYKVNCKSGDDSKDVKFGPYNQKDKSGGMKMNIVGSLNTEVLQTCPTAHRRINTDVSFTIQREKSSSSSSVTYMKLRPDGGASDLETFTMSKGTTGFTQLKYDGKFLTCSGKPGDNGVYDFPDEREIKRNDVLTTIPRLGKTFSVKFEVKPTRNGGRWTNVLHLTTGGNCCNNGQRIPAVLLDSRNKMYVAFSVNGRGNHLYSTEDGIPSNRWTAVEIKQFPEDNAYRYEVVVNGKTIGSIVNNDARQFDAVQVFTAWQWSIPTPGSIRKLRIEGGIPDTKCQNLPVGEKVPAVVVSLDFNPRNGNAYNNEWNRNKFSVSGSHYGVECLSGDEVCYTPGQQCYNGDCVGNGDDRTCQCKEGFSRNEEDICVPAACKRGYEKNSMGYCKFVGSYNEAPRCRGEENNCCTEDYPCEIGEGDCDYDNQCAGGLVCGYNNCDKTFGNGDDCCTNNTLTNLDGADPVELKKGGFKFQNDPTVRPLKLMDGGVDVGKLLELDLAINTAQTGRTFEDRSHAFSILKRPPGLVGKEIYNVEVRGKRGNIVQVYPAVEYDYTPSILNVKKGSMLHMQWTGSDRNPQNNDGNGQRGTDRNNVILMREEPYAEGTVGKAVPLDKKNGHWGGSYPNTFKNAEGKSLMGFGREDLQRLALVNNVSLIPENELLVNLPEKRAESGPANRPKLELKCDGGRDIRILAATFAGTKCDGASRSLLCQKCFGRETVEKVKERCAGKSRCEIYAHSGTFAFNRNDCPRDIEPKLKVSYKCLKFDGDSYADLNPSSHYFNMEPRALNMEGEFKYMCSRNNDFSNRSQKGKIKVEA